MCGACGSGRTRGPWEDAVDGAGPSARRRRAAALTRLLVAWRWRVEPWGTGYAVHSPVGALPPAGGVDDVVARAARARPEAFATLRASAPEPAGAAEAVVRASVLAWWGGGLRVSGPEVPRASLVHAHGTCPVELAPASDAWWVATHAA